VSRDRDIEIEVLFPNLKHRVQATSAISVDRFSVPDELRRQVLGSRPFPPPLAMHIASSNRLQTPSHQMGCANGSWSFVHRCPRSHDLANFAIGQAFADQNRNLTFRWAETRARCRNCPISFANTASQLHRLTSSEDFDTQKQRAKVMFTVHRLMLTCSPIPLLLHPCTSKFKTCLSRASRSRAAVHGSQSDNDTQDDLALLV